MRIAFLEDDRDQAQLLQLWLEEAGHVCMHFETSEQFLKEIGRESYDLIMLDWVLPHMSGVEVMKLIRENHDWPIPILFVTQRDQEKDIVEALEAGADDYMAKPVKKLELLARVGALARRASVLRDAEESTIELPPFSIDFANREIQTHGEKIKLTQKEYELAAFLFRNIGRVVSRSHLLESVWGTNPDINTRTVDTHISRIRQKLAITPETGWRLSAIYQHGYRLERLTNIEE
ncbi:MAG: response regulator transcription factor [Gammaproteobacteria bacterium]|nr:response regulator transcription factor [Gammaproteobacteria bacterium]